MTTAIVKRLGGKTLDHALDQAAERLADVTRTAIDRAVAQRGVTIAADADIFRLERRELDAAALERALVRSRARRGGVMGLASGLPSVVAGPGTVVEVGAAVADAAALIYAEVATVVALCHLRGLDVRDVEARRLDVLLSLGLAFGAVKRDGTRVRLGDDVVDLREIPSLPPAVVGKINRELGERIVAKVVRRRAAVLAGRLVPFGVGVAVAGWEDYRGVGQVGRAAIAYLDAIETARSARP